MRNQLNILLGGLGLFALQGCKAPQAEQARQPNVIYVFPDQYRNQAMEFWGQEGFREKVNFRNDPVHTPRLNDFARESLVLTSAMSNCPLSSPHRGSLLTGMYPNKSGIPLNCNSDRPISSLREDVDCVSDVFSNAGYDCAYFGKLHADFPTPNDPQRPGKYVEDRVPAWDAYTPKDRRHGFNYWYAYGTFDEHKNPHYWDTDGKRHDPREWSPLHESGKVVSYLKKKGIKKLNILVGTHPDSDHVGGLDDVINNVQVDTVYLPEAKKQTKTYRDVESALKSVNKTAQMPEIGKEYRFEKNVVIRFLGPLKNYKEANNNSLVVQLAYGKNRFLFMGDAEEKAEEDMIKENYDLECDVLKVGHHGSYTATGDNFLTKADPAYAVISAGKDNSYGHPHAATLAKLEDDDVQIYRTDTMGTIEAVSDGNQIHMETEKGKINE